MSSSGTLTPALRVNRRNKQQQNTRYSQHERNVTPTRRLFEQSDVSLNISANRNGQNRSIFGH